MDVPFLCISFNILPVLRSNSGGDGFNKTVFQLQFCIDFLMLHAVCIPVTHRANENKVYTALVYLLFHYMLRLQGTTIIR
jgi:hypothetical protein